MKNSKLIAIIGTLISMLLLGFLITSIPLSEIIFTLENVDLSYIIFGFVLYIMTYIFRTIRFFILLNKEVKLFDLFSIVCLHNFFNSIFPARSGEVSYILLLKKNHNRDISDGIATLVVSRIFDFFFIGVFFILIVNTLPNIPNSIYMAMNLTLLLIIGVILSLVIINKVDFKAIEFMPDAFYSKYIKKYTTILFIFNLVCELYKNVLKISKKGAVFLIIISIISFLIWSIQYSMMYYIALSMQINIGFIPILFAVSLSFLTSLLPIQGIAGFGTTEVGWALGFIMMGLSHEQAISTGIGFHLILIIFFSILGFWGLIGLKISTYLKKKEYTVTNH